MHVNHKISPESANWANFVKDYCNEVDVPCEVVEVDISKFGNNIERAARQARYEAFARQPFKKIMLGHHGDDQCETFFLKLFRGSGLKGLRCMSKIGPSWIDPQVTLLRPLLTWNKDRITNYATDHNVPNIEDLSNSDVRYDRNWIRHELWPTVIKRNEIADINLHRSIALINEGWELTQDLAKIDLESCKNSDGSLDWSRVVLLSKSRVKNLILYILDQNSVTGFSTHHIEDFVKSLNTADLDSRNELNVKGFVIRKTGKKIVFEN